MSDSGSVRQQFEDFKAKFERQYESAEEEERRFKIFEQNLKTITEHNAEYEKGIKTWSMGINNFADKEPNEITTQLLLTRAQVPQRLNIPGAVLLQPAHRQIQNRPQRINHQLLEASQIPLRIRKPIPNALPISIPIREDTEEGEQKSILDEEVAKFSVAAFQAKNQQPDNDVDLPRPVQFRPERPIPIQNLQQRSPIRQDLDDEPIFRQQVRQPQVRQQQQQQQPQQAPIRQKPKPIYHKPHLQNIDEEDGRRNRNRKPPVQILRKYRTDNDDGSITWGFENEDGTFKEENIGTDCIIRGKYGYIDPEGTRREYSYEAGNKCDPIEEEELEEQLPGQQNIPSRPNKKQYAKA